MAYLPRLNDDDMTYYPTVTSTGTITVLEMTDEDKKIKPKIPFGFGIRSEDVEA